MAAAGNDAGGGNGRNGRDRPGGAATDEQIAALAEHLAEIVGDRGLAVATAESLTGGQLAADLARATDASDWFAGGVVAYSRSVKHTLLDVPRGPVVSQAAAAAMAANVARLLDADLAVSVTGVGGPAEQDGQPPGTVWFGVRSPEGTETHLERFPGDPGDVLAATRRHALELLLAAAEAAVPAG